jgi:hypothetical protein
MTNNAYRTGSLSTGSGPERATFLRQKTKGQKNNNIKPGAFQMKMKQERR